MKDVVEVPFSLVQDDSAKNVREFQHLVQVQVQVQDESAKNIQENVWENAQDESAKNVRKNDHGESAKNVWKNNQGESAKIVRESREDYLVILIKEQSNLIKNPRKIIGNLNARNIIKTWQPYNYNNIPMIWYTINLYFFNVNLFTLK